jgi:hypothetical protein
VIWGWWSAFLRLTTSRPISKYSGVVREYGYPLGLNRFHGFGNVRPPCHGKGAWVNFSARLPGRITRGHNDG